MRGPRALVLAPAFLGLAAGGCGRRPAPPARAVESAAADSIPPSPAPPRAPARDSASGWREPREAYDRCRRADGSEDRPEARVEPGSAAFQHEHLGPGLAFLCTLRDGHPARLAVQGDEHDLPVRVLVYDPPAAAAPSDTLPIGEEPGDAEPPYPGAAIMEGQDLDGDGWADVRVMTYYGSGGRLFDVFRYDPRRGRFAKDTVLSGLGNVRREGRCARTSYAYGAGDYGWTDWCPRNGSWVATRREKWDDTPSTRHEHVSVHERSELRGGRMRVVSSDTTRERVR